MTTRTADLTLTFSVERQDDDGWPWIATLTSITPRGTGLGPSTSSTPLAPLRLELESVFPAQGYCSRCDEPAGGRTCGTCRLAGSVECEEGNGCPTGSYENWKSKPVPPPTGSRICDACAVETSIDNVGTEGWLLQCDAPIIFDPMPDDSRFKRPAASGLICNQEGTLEVDGFMEWYHYNGVDGEDWDEMFHVLRNRFTPIGGSSAS